MTKYRKKPVVITATQWFELQTGDMAVRQIRMLEGYVSGPCKSCRVPMEHHGEIDTLEGVYIVCPGDWIITDTDIEGEKYPCKPDIFALTYELYCD